MADDGVGEGEVELEVAVAGGGGDKAGVSRVKVWLILAENGEVCVGECRKYLRLTLASSSKIEGSTGYVSFTLLAWKKAWPPSTFLVTHSFLDSMAFLSCCWT